MKQIDRLNVLVQQSSQEEVEAKACVDRLRRELRDAERRHTRAKQTAEDAWLAFKACERAKGKTK